MLSGSLTWKFYLGASLHTCLGPPSTHRGTQTITPLHTRMRLLRLRCHC